MEDEDGTCLLDVLCDPQALNDFLHGTKELLSGDLLINSSSGEPSLFTDTPSPVSLLADDAGSHDTPASGCVDLSFLDEALLASPTEEEDSEELHDASEVQAEVQQPQQQEQEDEQEEETCDILQQSLQEADITEHTLALEAGLAPHGEPLSLYPSDMPLPSPTYLSKPLNISGVSTLPRDTQVAVEPPQPSLLAVGPGCPSLKPAAPQLMGLLPGNVFPTPSPETSFSLNPAQGSSMIIRKTLPGRQLLTPAVRTTGAPEIILQRTPLPIQPKLPVNIQPRLVQISPKPSGQKSSSGLTFIPPAASQNILLSSAVTSKQPSPSQPTPTLNKPVSLQLVNQGGSIVIQPQGLFQGQSHFLLPSQSPVTVSQSTSTARPLLTTVNNQMPSGAPSAGHLVDGSQIVTVRPRQLNFSPVFTTPTGQLTLRQGALLSGPLQLQSAPPTVFQMPAQLTGAYAPHPQGQHGAVVHSPALGNQITLINSPSVLTPDMTSISIVNGPSVVQNLPFVSQAQRLMAGGPEEQLSLPQTPVLLLPERTVTDKTEANEQLQSILQQSRLSSPVSVQPPVAEMHSQSSPVVTLLQAPPESTHTPEPVASLSKHMISQPEKQQAVEEVRNSQNQAFILHPQQQALSATAESLSEMLLADSHISPAASDTEASPAALAVCSQSDALSILSERGGMPTPAHSGSEHSDMLSSPPILHCSGSTPSTMFPTPPLSDREPMASSAFVALTANPQGQEESVLCLSPSSAPEKMCLSEQQPASTGLSGALEAGLCGVQQHLKQSKLRAPGVMADAELVLPDLQESHKIVSSQGTQITTTLQVQISVPSVSVKEKESFTPAMRQYRIKQQICSDHNAVFNPNTRSRFISLEDAVRHLLPYHTCSRALPSHADLMTVDKQFENVSGLLLNRTTDMLNKYRKLLLAESQQESPSAEMVMLERLFLQSERFSLGEERRRARGDPESFLMSLRKASLHRSLVPSGHADASGSPPSPPAWSLHSDRPPGLKTYRSRSRGALRLTIKHESGSRKVIHNSVCDNPHTPSGLKRTSGGQLTNGGDVQEKQEALKPSLVSPPVSSSQPVKQAVARGHTDTDTNRTACDLDLPHSTAKLECTGESPEDLLPELCPPGLKRTKLDSSDALCPGSSPLVEDSGLSEHLQSAIDSILELQRLQGTAAGVKPKLQQSHSLEQAVSCMLEGEL
ncbi:BRD4-interacting chromatin-remodeling complex-associated protein isoform X1 [Pygocentrus nattereri]|uniref:GLTSCR protein conserved domain-containing protein n=1 Tax=Pygocentrus nattereri TaxID=42514 RepID=A0A3B4DNQ2_PYGNA|nr:BRD4-interacting chromatin-remodeling complex-associated protein isoform X1 [Pygocentrus nattereri]XP_017555236.1 BRD4-interacting chromatin-remodeling complex-associated protein isoform X1 [Pygocentrus nattereri]